MKEPLVSVQMITYNHAAFVGQAIESVLYQKTSFPFELVIGEDCSTDGTREIVMGYEQKYPDVIRVVTSDNNVGVTRNWHRTRNACFGKYIAFCEGDDYWHHLLKMQKQVDYLEAHPECGMVHSDYDVRKVRTDRVVKNFLRNRTLLPPADPSISQIVSKCRVSFRIQTCTVMLRRCLLEQIVDSDPYLYKSEQFLMADTQLWAEVAAVSKIAFLPESLATYQLLEESASRSNDPVKKCLFELSDCDMKLYLCDKHGLPQTVRRDIERIRRRVSLRLAFHERNASLAADVKRSSKGFGWKEWLFYLGARNRAAHALFCSAALLRDFVRTKQVN